MKYLLSVFNGSAFVERNRKRRRPDRGGWLHNNEAGVYFPRGSVRAQLKALSSFVADLATNINTLEEERRKNFNVTYRISDCRITLRSDPAKAAKQFARVFNEIHPLLELGRVTLEQMRRCPLTTSASVEVFVPKQEINGVSANHFLESRKEAALKINSATALIARTRGVYRMDPYGVYSNIPDLCKDVYNDYYACAPGSTIWVYSQDLPEETRRALEKQHKLQPVLKAYSY